MKEKIYTIPVNEAFDADTECPLCCFLKKEELAKIEYVLGASMMEPDERVEFNKKGFCGRHTEMMFEHGNKLSHALIEETRLAYLSDAIKSASSKLKAPKKSIFKSAGFADGAGRALLPINEAMAGCVVCERLDEIFAAFIENLFYLYKNDEKFRQKFFKAKGFCVKHFLVLAESSTKYLGDTAAYEFVAALCKFEAENLDRVKDDVSRFTKMFDYRFKKDDLKISKDALARACEKSAMYLKYDAADGK